jgi:16S rRNA (guanine527-N7)-methyltransferase
MSIFSDTLEKLIKENSIECTQDTVAKCEEYFNLLVEANKTTNLTRITDEAAAAQMHFFGAMELTKHFDLPDGAKVIDVGSGAGFPGIPLKIIRPGLDMTLMDSVGKKTDFIKTAAEKTSVSVNVITARAEEVTELYDTFDVVLSRAVASLNVLLELCAPLLKTGGSLIAFKGETHEDELAKAKSALSVLFCSVSSVHTTGEGAIIIIKKEKPTPEKYPRRFSKIKSSPL